MNTAARTQASAWQTLILLAASLGLIVLGSLSGSTGWHFSSDTDDLVLWTIRAPRSVGAWCAGAALGLAGAVAQGLFRNPLADPFLLGSSSGAALGVTAAWVALGAAPLGALPWLHSLGLTGAAFGGALAAVLLSVALARGVQHSLRLLLGGVVVSVVLGAATSLIALWWPHVLSATQGFMLGNTALLDWRGVALLGACCLLALALALALARVLDALSLGEDSARSLGLPLTQARWALIAVIALCSAVAVSQTGLIAFIGLAAPHVVRSWRPSTHGSLLLHASLAGGVLLLGADVIARLLIAPQELPVGVLTALVGGGYLLWRLRHTPVDLT